MLRQIALPSVLICRPALLGTIRAASAPLGFQMKAAAARLANDPVCHEFVMSVQSVGGPPTAPTSSCSSAPGPLRARSPGGA
ncbi:hypothetical protein ACFQ1I_05060 [Kitasatospora arboriphila]